MTLASCTIPASVADLNGIDDADDRRVDRTVFQSRRHPGGAAADDEYGLADAGVDGIDRDQVAAVDLAARIHRPGDQQFSADQPWILARSDDGPDDFSEQQMLLRGGGGLADRQGVL